jgi:hypothetical protein
MINKANTGCSTLDGKIIEDLLDDLDNKNNCNEIFINWFNKINSKYDIYLKIKSEIITKVIIYLMQQIKIGIFYAYMRR